MREEGYEKVDKWGTVVGDWREVGDSGEGNVAAGEVEVWDAGDEDVWVSCSGTGENRTGVPASFILLSCVCPKLWGSCLCGDI